MNGSEIEQHSRLRYDSELQRKHYSGIKLLAILAGGFFLLLVAVMLVPSVLNVDYMFTMGAVLVFLPAAAAILTIVWSRGLSAERQPIDPVFEGATRRVRVKISQRFPTNLMAEALESLPKGLQSDPPMPLALHIQGFGCEFSYDLLPLKRGVYTIPPPRLRIIDPLGVTSLVRRGAAGSEVVVYPKPMPLEEWNMVSSSAPVGWLADALARPSSGASAEFYGTREYYPGDDLRRVHWPSVARFGELVVKEFTDDADAEELIIALDTQIGSDESDGEEGPLDYRTRVAAFVAQKALLHGARVALATAAAPGELVARAEDISKLPLMLDNLARARAIGELPLAEVLSLLDYRIQRGTVVVIITSTVDDALRSVVADTWSRGVEIAQVYVDPASFRGNRTARTEQSVEQYMLHSRIPCWRMQKGGAS